MSASFAPLAGRGLKQPKCHDKTWLSGPFAPLAGRGLKLISRKVVIVLSNFRPARGARIETGSDRDVVFMEADRHSACRSAKYSVNGGEKPWRLAGSGGRLNRAAPKCSVVDFVSRRKAVIMAGFWVKDLEGDK